MGRRIVPYSGYARGAPPPPDMGIDSRRPPLDWGGKPGPNGFPLLARFSAARSTSGGGLLAWFRNFDVPILAPCDSACNTTTTMCSLLHWLITYRQIARQRHWPHLSSCSSRVRGPACSVALRHCSHCVRCLSARAAAAVPTKTGGRVLARPSWGRCSRPCRLPREGRCGRRVN